VPRRSFRMYLSSTEGDRSSLPSFLIFLFESFLPKSGILPNSRAYTRTICAIAIRNGASSYQSRNAVISSIFVYLPLDDRRTPMHRNALRTDQRVRRDKSAAVARLRLSERAYDRPDVSRSAVDAARELVPPRRVAVTSDAPPGRHSPSERDGRELATFQCEPRELPRAIARTNRAAASIGVDQWGIRGLLSRFSY